MLDRKIVFSAIGDCFLKNKLSLCNPFIHVKDILNDSDVRVLNLETVLTDTDIPIGKKWIHIKTNPSSVTFLKEINVDVVNLAHNHIKDYGKVGFNDTLKYLTESGISYIGVGNTISSATKHVSIHKNGLKIAIIGFYQYEKSEPDNDIYIASIGREDFLNVEDNNIPTIQKLKKTHDIVIVSLHWGYEHIIHPSPGQIKYAHVLIDNGADLIIGHHPHCVQGFERYKNGLIAYSLGNFNFWQPDIKPKWINRLSLILQVELTKEGVSNFDLIPIKIDNNYMPVTITDKNRELAIDYFNKLSQNIIYGSVNWKNWFNEFGPIYIPQTLKSFMIGIYRYGFDRLKDMIRWMKRKFTIIALLGVIRVFIRNKPKYYTYDLKKYIEK